MRTINARRISHPLAVLLSVESKPTQSAEETPAPEYDPLMQMQFVWKDIRNHLDILMSGKSTGDPDTRSATTEYFTGSDDDTDDSGT